MTEDLGVGLRISDARPRTWDVGVPGVDLKDFPPNIHARGLRSRSENYMVYRVFTVFSGLLTVHNLFKLCYLQLFCDYAARNTVARVSRRVRLHIVCLGMNHQRRAAVAE